MWSVKDQGGSLEDSQATAARSLCRCVVCSVGCCACLAASKDSFCVLKQGWLGRASICTTRRTNVHISGRLIVQEDKVDRSH